MNSNPKNRPPIENIVFSGGGVKGLTYVGVIQYMEEIGLLREIKRILGVSVGSVFGLFIVLGMKYQQIKNLMLQISPHDLIDFDFESIKVDMIIDFFKNSSIDSGDKVFNFIRACLKVKLGNPDATFRDLYEYNPNMELYVLGTELAASKRIYFSYLNTPDFSIALAIRISCALPLYMKPIIHEGKIYVDGGVSCNYPIDFFDNDIERTIGFVFINNTEDDNKVYTEIPDFLTYGKMIMNTFFWSLEKHFYKKYNDYTYYLKLASSDTVAFELPLEVKETYFRLGYESFSEQWVNRLKQYKKEDIDDSELLVEYNTSISTDEEFRETEEIKFEMNSMKNNSS